MRTSIATVEMMVVFVGGGCAHRGGEVAEVRRENVELKSRIALLESQVAELKDRQQQTPITVNGLTLSSLEAPPELKLTANVIKVMPRESTGQGRLILSGVGGAPATVGTIEMSIDRRPIGDGVWQGTITNLTRATSTTTTARTTTTTTTPATSAAPAK